MYIEIENFKLSITPAFISILTVAAILFLK